MKKPRNIRMWGKNQTYSPWNWKIQFFLFLLMAALRIGRKRNWDSSYSHSFHIITPQCNYSVSYWQPVARSIRLRCPAISRSEVNRGCGRNVKHSPVFGRPRPPTWVELSIRVCCFRKRCSPSYLLSVSGRWSGRVISDRYVGMSARWAAQTKRNGRAALLKYNNQWDKPPSCRKSQSYLRDRTNERWTSDFQECRAFIPRTRRSPADEVRPRLLSFS